jgi:hypothetical protein
MRSASASLRMEGFDVTPRVEKNAIKILNGTLSVEEFVRQVKHRSAKKQTANLNGKVQS